MRTDASAVEAVEERNKVGRASSGRLRLGPSICELKTHLLLLAAPCCAGVACVAYVVCVERVAYVARVACVAYVCCTCGKGNRMAQAPRVYHVACLVGVVI